MLGILGSLAMVLSNPLPGAVGAGMPMPCCLWPSSSLVLRADHRSVPSALTPLYPALQDEALLLLQLALPQCKKL